MRDPRINLAPISLRNAINYVELDLTLVGFAPREGTANTKHLGSALPNGSVKSKKSIM